MALEDEYPKELVDFVKDELKKGLEKELANQPWWCMICGEGGNYEGERPDDFWYPPDDHKCPGYGKPISRQTMFDMMSYGDLPPTKERLEAIGKVMDAFRYGPQRRPEWMDEVERRCGLLTLRR